MKSIHDQINNINSKEDFIEFLNILITDLRTSEGKWENDSLESYLEAMAGWTEDMDGFYLNQNQPVPKDINWKVFANILMAAAMYE